MTHSIHTSDTGGELPYFQRLWRTLLAPAVDPQTKLEQLFHYETAEFDLNYAYLSHIDLENETQRFEVAHGSHEVIKPGNTVPLSKTYCRKTIEDPEGTVAISDAIAEGWADDPAYETLQLESYLGTTVVLDGDLYGTLCFANRAARDEPIGDREKSLVEMHGQWIAYTLSLFDGSPVWGTGVDAIEERAVSSDAIDSMMDALRKPTRRLILMTLVGNSTETSLATLERQVTGKKALISLIHTDLPRLANAGYITWDTESETISKGPKFSEVEPLVRLLQEYNTSFPE